MAIVPKFFNAHVRWWFGHDCNLCVAQLEIVGKILALCGTMCFVYGYHYYHGFFLDSLLGMYVKGHDIFTTDVVLVFRITFLIDNLQAG